jgi:hypothetical protein
MEKLPTCCGSKMNVSLELGRFVEVQCLKCGDVVYIKNTEVHKPVLIDD